MAETQQCPECDSAEITTDHVRGETVCGLCGLVLDELDIDRGPDWRDFSEGESRSRVGAPLRLTLHDMGMSTTIDWKMVDGTGRAITGRDRARLYRIRKWHQRTRVANTTQRNLMVALSELERLSSQMELTQSVREHAALIYRRAVKNNLIRGRSINGMVAASLYAACRQLHVPRSLEEVCGVTGFKKKELGRNFRILNRQLQLRLPVTTPRDYIRRVGSQLNLSHHSIERAMELYDEMADHDQIAGKGPLGTCAAVLYITSILTGERRTQSEIATVSGVTEVTIRNRYKEIVKILDLDL